ncbi:MAG: hypothetical protein R2813_04565 [Flavobacteriales bacterium]
MREGLVIVTATMIVVGCSNPEMEKVNQLKAQCIKVHDEVMPRLGEVVSLSSEVAKERKALMDDTTQSAADYRSELASHVLVLDSAHEAMMLWMEEYEPEFEAKYGVDSAVRYYSNELERIGAVSELMLKSIEDGKKVLDSH